MTKFAITAVELDGAGEVGKGKVHQIIGGNRDLPSLSEGFEILDRIALIDIISHVDELYAPVERDGQHLPPHEVRIRRAPDGNEYVESVQNGRVTDALARLPRLRQE
jgi:hypothetical protein